MVLFMWRFDMKRIGFVALFLLVFSSYIFAEDTWTYITEVNGQEFGYINDMASDSQGTIWITSKNGIFSYKNGVWTYINQMGGWIFIAPNDDAWIINSYKINRYDGETWTSIDTPEMILFAGVDAQGVVWCSSNNGVLRYNGTQWDVYTTENGLYRNATTYLSVSPSGDVWVAYGDPLCIDCISYDYGVSHFNGDTWETYNSENVLLSDIVDDIVISQDNTVYIKCWTQKFAYGGVMKFDGNEWETISEIHLGKLTVDYDGKLWVINNDVFMDPEKVVIGCLNKYDGISWERYAEIELPMEGDFYEYLKGPVGFDSEGRMWLAAVKGIIKYDISTDVNNKSESQSQTPIFLNNYPNPFNSSTTLTFDLPVSGMANIAIYNVSGQKISTLINNFMSVGTHSMTFKNDNLPSGIYFAQLEANGISKTLRMLLIK